MRTSFASTPILRNISACDYIGLCHSPSNGDESCALLTAHVNDCVYKLAEMAREGLNVFISEKGETGAEFLRHL